MSIHPGGLQRALAESRDAADGQTPFHTEFRFLREDGGVVWARVNSAPMNDGRNDWAEAQGHVLTVEDISLRKSAESY